MALEALTVEYEHTDDGFTEHTTFYATRVRGDWYQSEDGGDRFNFGPSDGWRVGDAGLLVYPEEVDGYIDLFRKIKATADATD